MNTSTAPAIEPAAQLRIDAIEPSPTNPRKRFDTEKLEHLADTMIAQGILQRLLVRPWPGRPGVFECVDGERRLRAAKSINRAMVPVEIREMTDAEVIAVQLVTGETGEPLSPFEEAEGFERALDSGLHTVESIASGIGRDPTYVSQRRRLLRLPKEMREAVEGGALPVSTAALVGAIPDELDRKVAALAIMPNGQRDEPLTYKQAQALIRERWMVGLRDAPFELGDETLAGPDGTPRACRNCPYLEDKGKGGVVVMCTLPRCYRQKCNEQWGRNSAKAQAAGQRVLTDEETVEVFEKNSPTVQIAFSSPYVDVNSKPTYRHVPNEVEDKNLPTWRELVTSAAEKKGIKVPVVLARDRTGKQWELVQVALAIEAARAIGEDMFKKVPVTESLNARDRFDRDAVRAAVRQTDNFAKKKRAEAEAAKRRAMEGSVVLAALHAALADVMVGAPAVTTALLPTAMHHAGNDGLALVAKAFGLRIDAGEFGASDAVTKWFNKLSEMQREAAIPVLLIAQSVRWNGLKCDALVGLAKAVRLDLAAIEKQVAAALTGKQKARGQGTPKPKKRKAATERPRKESRAS